MYTIDIHHKGDSSPTTYTIFNKKEAKDKKIEFKYWRDANEGEYGISDDDYVAKVISRSIYKPTSIYVRFPFGYAFYNPKYTSTTLKAAGRKSNNTISGKTHWEVLSKGQTMKNLAMVYAQTMNYDKTIDYVFNNPNQSKRQTWKHRMKKENFRNMVRDELQKLLQEHGMTEAYTLELLEETIKKAKDKGDVTNLMRAVDNLQDMHGMKDKHLIKTTESLEATSNVKLIDELREEEEKLIATRTTTKEEK
jgi:sarcosine oxidase delta subunit